MWTSLICIQFKDRSLEQVRDSWISRYVLTLSIVFQLMLGSMHILLIRNDGEDQQGIGEGQAIKEEELERPHQGGVHVQLDFDSTLDSRTRLHQNWRPHHIRSRILKFYIWLEQEFHWASNGTDPTSKFLLSRRESSTQLDVQNLSGCCVTIFWAAGPCTVLEPVRVASRGLARP
jgi:hypothetical protein